MSTQSRLALKLEYNGAKFCGSQYQSGVRSVQDTLEQALAVLAKERMRVVLSGRTDSGVHASGQVAHCDWPGEAQLTASCRPDLHKLCWSMNGILPRDLAVAAMQWVSSDFHARFSALKRQYVYKILNRPQRSPLLQTSSYFVPAHLDIDSMQTAAACLTGEHDFSAFKSSNGDGQDATCRVTRSEILNLGEGVLEFQVEANRFVYNMVRVIAGTLVEIGLGKRTLASLEVALNSKDRNEAGATAPAWGLCLTAVDYPENYELFKLFSDNPGKDRLIREIV